MPDTMSRDAIIQALRAHIVEKITPYIMGGLTEAQLEQCVAFIPSETNGSVTLTLRNQSHDVISAIADFQRNDPRVRDDPECETMHLLDTDPVTGKIITGDPIPTAIDRAPIREIDSETAFLFGTIVGGGPNGRAGKYHVRRNAFSLTADSWKSMERAVTHAISLTIPARAP